MEAPKQTADVALWRNLCFLLVKKFGTGGSVAITEQEIKELHTLKEHLMLHERGAGLELEVVSDKVAEQLKKDNPDSFWIG